MTQVETPWNVFAAHQHARGQPCNSLRPPGTSSQNLVPRRPRQPARNAAQPGATLCRSTLPDGGQHPRNVAHPDATFFRFPASSQAAKDVDRINMIDKMRPDPVHPVHPVASRRGGTFRNGVERRRSFHSKYRCDGSYARVSCSGWELSAGSASSPLARRIRPTSATMRSIRAWCAATLFHVRYSEATM